MTRKAIALWLAVISLLVALPVFGQDSAELSRSFFVDESRTASITDVMDAEFAPYTGSIARGYSDAALWIRLSIAGSNSVEDLSIVVSPAFLRRIELYDPSIRGLNAEPVLSGRDAPIAANNHVGLDSGFIIPSTRYKRDVYLRLTTTTSLTADISVMPAEIAAKTGFIQGGLVAVFIAFLLIFGVWGLMAWTIRRDALFGLFALRQLFSSAHIFVYFGSFRFFLAGIFDAQVLDGVYVFVCCTVASATGLFDIRLISEFGGARLLRQAVYVVLLFPVLSLPLAAMGYGQIALQASVLIVNLQMLMLAALAFTAKADKAKPLGAVSLGLVRVGYIVMTIVVIMPLLMYLNILHTSVPLFKIVFLHAIISTVILFGLLLIRNRQRDLAEQETRIMLVVRELELRKESSRRVEKERFLSMLTHELRNPLSVIQLLSNLEKANLKKLRQAADDMADVISRVEQSERVDSGQLYIERTVFDLSDLVRHVVHAKIGDGRVVHCLYRTQLIASDQKLMRHILENLLDNSKKYSPKGTSIFVELTAESLDSRDGVMVRITNEIGSSGIPDPDLLFTKYYRSSLAHRQPGSGLGLFLVASWVSALGGTVGYAPGNEVDRARAATFSIWVPR